MYVEVVIMSREREVLVESMSGECKQAYEQGKRAGNISGKYEGNQQALQ